LGHLRPEIDDQDAFVGGGEGIKRHGRGLAVSALTANRAQRYFGG
jgi:hypothetical protein